MRLAIMQPYLFPYIGYISLIKNTDRFILFDTPQFIRHGWIERNRILKQNEGWLYIQVPLQKFHQTTPIKDVLINNSTDWPDKIKAQLQHYKKIAPNFYATMKVLDDIFSEKFDDIVSLNHVSLSKICKYLGIDRNIEILSKLNLQIYPANEPDEWALNICKAIGNVNEYWNPVAGQSFFDKTKYEKNNLTLKFHSIKLLEYNQKRSPFESGLSVIDVMMFNDVEKINMMLNNFELL